MVSDTDNSDPSVEDPIVLILVLMEYGLGQVCCHEANRGQVLILVLMEYGLGQA